MDQELPESHAFLSWGRWVAECGWSGCGNAKAATPGQEHLTCDAPPDNVGVCLRTTRLVWPDNVAERVARVSGLPVQERSDVVPGSPQDREPDPEPVVGAGQEQA